MNNFSSHKSKTSKPCFRWLATFIPSWMLCGKGKLDQEGRVWESCWTHPLIGQTNRPPCFLHDVTALTRNWGMDSHCEILTQLCDTSFFVSVPWSETSCFCSWRSGNIVLQSFGKSILVVNQPGKRAFIGCLHQTSQINVQLRVNLNKTGFYQWIKLMIVAIMGYISKTSLSV